MPTKVMVEVELSDLEHEAYADEARRRGVTVQAVVQQMVRNLVEELHREEREGTDHLIIPS